MEEEGTLRPGGTEVLLIDLGIDVSVDDEEVEPAVVVVVEEGGAQPRKGMVGSAMPAW